jgi:hypothetical protein
MRRQKRPRKFDRPLLDEDQILAWADAYLSRAGTWPMANSGPIPEAPGANWGSVNTALVQGCRGLPGGSSLARLLAERRHKRNSHGLPHYTEEQITGVGRRIQRADRRMAHSGIGTRCARGRGDVASSRCGAQRRLPGPARGFLAHSPPGQASWRAQPHGASAHYRSADPAVGRRLSPAQRQVAVGKGRRHSREPGSDLVCRG